MRWPATLTKVKKNFSTAVSVHDDSRRRGAKAKRVDCGQLEQQDLKQPWSLPKLIVFALVSVLGFGRETPRPDNRCRGRDATGERGTIGKGAGRDRLGMAEP